MHMIAVFFIVFLLFAFLNVLQLVGWTAIMIYDGALALGGMRILQGEENARIYHIVNGKEGQG